MYNVVLIGATGLIGKQCLQNFLSDSDCSHLIVIARRGSEINNPKLKEIISDLGKLNELTIPDSENTVFVSALGTTIKQAKSEANFKRIDFDYNLEFAHLAKKHNASKYILVSSLGADSGSSNFYLQTKGLLEKEIRNLKLNCVYILRPSMLLGHRSEFRFGELIGKYAMQLIGFMFIGPLLKYKAIQSDKVADAILQLSKNECVLGFEIIESDRLQNF